MGSGHNNQDEFAEKLKLDPDMAEQGSGMVATAGSLSHSHLNCCMRNILCGKKGVNALKTRRSANAGAGRF